MTSRLRNAWLCLRHGCHAVNRAYLNELEELAQSAMVHANLIGDGWPQDALPPWTRVRVVKDPDWDGPWANEFTGTIEPTLPPQLVEHPMARPNEFKYFVAFDEPQRDADGDGPYTKAEVWDRYLEPI